MTLPAEKFMQQTQTKDAQALQWLEERPHDDAADWIKALRDTAAETLARTGLPTPKWEGWQYTSLRGLAPLNYRYCLSLVDFDAAKLPQPLLENTGRIVLVDGQLQRGLCRLPAGVEIMSLLEAAARKVEGLEEYMVNAGSLAEAPFRALNSAYMRDGFVLNVPKGREADMPVEVVFYTHNGVASYPRVLYKLGENSGLTVIERHIGEGTYFANTHAETVLERDSRFKFYRFVDESGTASHISGMTLNMMRNSQFEGFSGAFGGLLVRQEFKMQLLENAIYSSIGGAYVLSGRQSHDFTVLADHFEQDGRSVQHFKGVIDDQARAIFQGKIHVRRSAQKTDGYQSHHALLLSKTAEASAKPELEIYADDVKCSHGATSGHLDRDALFYMQSRGIPQDEARTLLVESFLAGTVEKITNEAVRDLYLKRISIALKRGDHDQE